MGVSKLINDIGVAETFIILENAIIGMLLLQKKIKKTTTTIKLYV
jgi:hypothetical protein